MNIASRWIPALLLSTVGAAVVLAQSPALNVKMGLWEITVTTDIGGQIAGMDTSKMTPEQAAQVQAMMKAAMSSRAPTVVKSCMTKEKLERSGFQADEPGTSCKQNITTNTSSTLDATISCQGRRTSTGHVHFEAPSSTSVKGTVSMANTEQGKTMTLNSTMTGQWLSADCGNVKP